MAEITFSKSRNEEAWQGALAAKILDIICADPENAFMDEIYRKVAEFGRPSIDDVGNALEFLETQEMVISEDADRLVKGDEQVDIRYVANQAAGFLLTLMRTNSRIFLTT